MIAPFSLQNAPSLMEVIFPVQRLSAEVFREKSTSSQILTSIGTYWKGRKPLILNKACVLGTLLPATGDDVGDLRLFERLMGMDPQALQARLRAALPRSRAPLAAEMAERYRRGELSYADLVRKAKRPEEMGEGFWEGVWDEVNAPWGRRHAPSRSWWSSWAWRAMAAAPAWRIPSAAAGRSPLRRRGWAVTRARRT